MRITEIEVLTLKVNHRGNWIICLIHTDAGIYGAGEASHSGDDDQVRTILTAIGKQIAGDDLRQLNWIWRKLNWRQVGRVYATALSAVEQALWDIVGQFLGVPCHTLFGTAIHSTLPLYANINRHIIDRSPEGFVMAAWQAVADGYRAIKIAPFDEVVERARIETGPAAAWQEGVARVRAVREAIGAEVELAVDCHNRFFSAEAIQVAAELEGCALFWFEEPVAHTYPEILANITQKVPMATASGESLFDLMGFRPFFVDRVVDVIMPDIKHCGGLRPMQSIAGAAHLQHLRVAPHQPAGPLATAATAEVISTVDNFYKLEHAWGEVAWRAELLDPPERIEAGELVVSQQPGLGHRINMDVVDAHRIRR